MYSYHIQGSGGCSKVCRLKVVRIIQKTGKPSLVKWCFFLVDKCASVRYNSPINHRRYQIMTAMYSEKSASFGGCFSTAAAGSSMRFVQFVDTVIIAVSIFVALVGLLIL